MKPWLTATIIALGLAPQLPSAASAYPIDCAILLCLAGGFPASVECTKARMVMIKRITPWPIEPPLQLWNCPLHAEYRSIKPVFSSDVRVWDAGLKPRRARAVLPAPMKIPLSKVSTGVDLAAPEYSFILSMKVYDASFDAHENKDGDCVVNGSARQGSYDTAGNFKWARLPLMSLPSWGPVPDPNGNPCYSRERFVSIEYSSFAGKRAHEVIDY